jgi:hypothetical protein
VRASSYVCARASYPGARASCHPHTIVAGTHTGASTCSTHPSRLLVAMSPFWIWTQIAIVVFVLIGMIIAIAKLA